MDPSPVQSSSKCGSDFSIKRILSSDSKTTSDKVEVPDWLCCTRYRPPRLPRAASGGGSRSRRSGRHARVPFTAAQAAALEAAYARAPYLAPPALRALAAALQLRDDRIKIWFQNRRARERREKCGNVAPPIAVTLPPTTSAHVSLMSSSTWTAISRSDMPSHHFSFNMAIEKSECQSFVKRTSPFERDSVPPSQLSSLRELADDDDDRPETPLDIETVED